jgi:hypothetical protein
VGSIPASSNTVKSDPDPGWEKIQIQDEHSVSFFCIHFLGKYKTIRIQIRDLVNPGSAMEKIWIRDKHSGSAPLHPAMKKKNSIQNNTILRLSSFVVIFANWNRMQPKISMQIRIHNFAFFLGHFCLPKLSSGSTTQL